MKDQKSTVKDNFVSNMLSAFSSPKTLFIAAAAGLVMLASCNRGLTPSQAANGARCGQHLR